MMGCARPWMPVLGVLGLVLLPAGCGTSRQAGAAVDAGRRAMEQGDLREALEHYRTATRLAPGSATAHLGRTWFRSSRERVPQYAFRVMVEAGRREQAIALARSRGWLRDYGDYCTTSELPVSSETAGLLAMMLQPDRADCLAVLGERLADDGLARLGRLVLLDRSQRSRSPEIKAQAEWVL